MSDYKYIGKDTPRPDAADKASGRALYIHDLSRPGMLFGKIKFSDFVHAKILNIDSTKAERLPGVKAVLTAANTPEIRIGFLKDNFAIKGGKVRHYRDEIAAVAASDPDIAAEAVESIEVEYEPLPAVFDPVTALEEGAPLVHELDPKGRPLFSNRIPLNYRHQSGDLDRARRSSAHIVADRFSTQMVQQSCLGTAGCIAEFDLNGNLTIWTKTQIPFLAQRDFIGALSAMGLPGKMVRVIVPVLGGGFGSGLDTHAYEYISILLAHRTNHPVKILYDRREEFANLSPRQPVISEIEQGCDKSGRLTFRRIEVLQDNGAYVSWGATYPSVMMIPVTSLYKVPTVHFNSTLVYTNNTYCQAMRGYGGPEVTFAIESNLDQLAEAAGIDPFELRRINVNEPGETTPMGFKVTTCGLKECLDIAERKIDRNKPGLSRSSGKLHGFGLASLCHVGGSGRIYRSDASGVRLKFDDFGNVYVMAGGVEMGQGHHSIISMGVAEALGVTPDRVHVTETDTAICPWDVGTHASRGAFTALCAIAIAAGKARERIFSLATEIFPREIERNCQQRKNKEPGFIAPKPDPALLADPASYQLADNVLFLKDYPGEEILSIELSRFLRAVHFRPNGTMIETEGFYDPPTELPDFEKGLGNMSVTYAYGTQAVEVEVDPSTGEVRIVRFVAVHDVGKVLNPQTLKGQTYGAIAQGIGYALYEQVKCDKGRIENPSFVDYKIPTIKEMAFPIELHFVETNDPGGPFGAKGVGEPGLVPTAPAIANAIYNAIGVRIKDLPITPEKILQAIATRNGQ